ncbi:hypothetical protein KH5_20890 [Urechidicola sp. KH5]
MFQLIPKNISIKYNKVSLQQFSYVVNKTPQNMKSINFLTLITLFIGFNSFCQEIETTTKQTIDSGTIDDQFNYLIKNSNRYQEYKVVKRVWIDKLRGSVNDSLSELELEVNSLEKLVAEKDSEINNLSLNLSTQNNTIEQLNKEKNGITLFGAIVSKPIYNSLLWSIIAILIAGLAIYIFRFNRSNIVTKETKEKFDDLEQEYEGFRQRSLEREQQIRRKLQDEINKQKKDK